MHDDMQCCQDPGHSHAPPGAVGTPERMIGEELDPAGRSLADALKVSFRVLGVIIVVLLAAYLASGVFTVKSDERAVVVRLGQLKGRTAERPGRLLRPGLHFGWPFPIDRVVVLPVHEQSLQIESFWYYVSPRQAGQEYSQMGIPSGGLRPGWDGALLTGDGGLMHVRWECKYTLPADEDEAILDYLTRLGGVPADRKAVLRPAEEAVTEAVETASIRVAAATELESIRRNEPRFTQDVQMLAQKRLDELGSGLRIRALQCVAHVPPLQTRAAFEEVTQAEQARSTMETNAQKQAATIKLEAAGQNWEPIMGAIGRYERAQREQDDQAEALAYQEIDRLLMDDTTGGQARRIIENARAESRQTVTRAQALADRFSRLLPRYLADPALTIHWEWTNTKRDILSRPGVIKQYAPKAGRGLVLYVQYDPQLLKRLREMESRKLEEQLEQAKQEQLRNR